MKQFEKELLLDIIKSLTIEKTIDKIKIKPIEDLRNKYKSKFKAVVKDYLTVVNERFNNNSFAFLIKYFESTIKSTSSNTTKDNLKQMIKEALATNLSEDLLSVSTDMVKELTKILAKDNDLINIDYKLVNQKAIDFIQNDMFNNFSTLDNDAAQGIFDTIATTMADSEVGYSISDIVSNIISSAFNPADENGKMYFPSRTIDVEDWSNMVALNVTATAASESLKSIAEDAGLETYQYVANNGACDDCDEYDNEIYTIGDGPEPPIHPNCECVMILVQSEIQAMDNTDNIEEDN